MTTLRFQSKIEEYFNEVEESIRNTDSTVSPYLKKTKGRVPGTHQTNSIQDNHKM